MKPLTAKLAEKGREGRKETQKNMRGLFEGSYDAQPTSRVSSRTPRLKASESSSARLPWSLPPNLLKS